MSAPGTDPAALSLVDAADAVRQGRLRSRDLVEACVARIERWQSRLNCFRAVEADEARAAADRADAELKAGRARGTLHGVPLAHKDMYYRRGKIATCGSKIRRDWVAGVDATAIARLRTAGALELGALNMVEFAYGPTGHNDHFGHVRNPWNPEYITGGSSSGSGSAVAARLTFGALGSDTGGSIRLPACACGTAGIKPTYGRVSRHGAMPLSFSLDTVGPLARTVRDCARLLSVIAGPDPNDPTASAEPVPDYEAAIARPARGLRLGVVADWIGSGVEPEIGAALVAATEVCRRLGAEIVEIAPPDLDALNASGQVVMFAEATSYHARWLAERPQDYSDQVRARLGAGFGVGAVQYLDALRVRASALDRFLREVFAGVDVLLAPVIPVATPTIAASDLGARPELGPLMATLTRYTRPFNFLGLPALSVPCGFSSAGLPIGLQLVGRPFDEAALFAIGHAYEQAAGWIAREPAAA